MEAGEYGRGGERARAGKLGVGARYRYEPQDAVEVRHKSAADNLLLPRHHLSWDDAAAAAVLEQGAGQPAVPGRALHGDIGDYGHRACGGGDGVLLDARGTGNHPGNDIHRRAWVHDHRHIPAHHPGAASYADAAPADAREPDARPVRQPCQADGGNRASRHGRPACGVSRPAHILLPVRLSYGRGNLASRVSCGVGVQQRGVHSVQPSERVDGLSDRQVRSGRDGRADFRGRHQLPRGDRPCARQTLLAVRAQYEARAGLYCGLASGGIYGNLRAGVR